jgi:hypothetical protein
MSRVDISRINYNIFISGPSQWQRGLRHEPSSAARTLGSWVRIPLKAWMFGVCMRLFCVCVVLCVGSGLATAGASSKESYRLYIKVKVKSSLCLTN